METIINSAYTHSIIDISHHQAKVNFKQLLLGKFTAVLHRSSLGEDFADKKYTERAQEVVELNSNYTTPVLLWGAYHFVTGSDALNQAKFFLERAKLSNATYPLLALDIEKNPSVNGTTVTLDIAEKMVEYIYSQTKIYPVIYGGNTFLGGLVKDVTQSILFNCPLWVSSWTTKGEPTTTDLIGNGRWTEWKIWQYTDGTTGGDPKGEVLGIYDTNDKPAACDRDRFHGSDAQLKEWWNNIVSGISSK